eukprot:scaffold97062_cov67-Attheya_sp.AAC.1
MAAMHQINFKWPHRAVEQGEQAKKIIDTGMVQLQGLTTFLDTFDFSRVVDNGKNRRSLQGGAKVAVAHDHEMEACTGAFDTGGGVVEQHKQFIFVDGVCFSPMCQWGQAKRPSGIQSDTVLNRCAQYFAIPSLNKNRIGVVLHKVEGCCLGLEKKETQQ